MAKISSTFCFSLFEASVSTLGFGDLRLASVGLISVSSIVGSFLLATSSLARFGGVSVEVSRADLRNGANSGIGELHLLVDEISLSVIESRRFSDSLRDFRSGDGDLSGGGTDGISSSSELIILISIEGAGDFDTLSPFTFSFKVCSMGFV